VIRPAIEEESPDKAAVFDKLVAGQILERSRFGPFVTYTKPIKPFTIARTQSILEQLTGRSEGLTAGGGFTMGPGGGSGLGNMFGRSLFQTLDLDNNSSLTLDEFIKGFTGLFKSWDTDKSGYLALSEVWAGIEKDLPPAQAFPFFGGGPRPPPGEPPPERQPTDAPPITVAGTQDPGLFMSEHFGMRSFSYKLPNGTYIAKLYFAEMYEGITGPGQRVFSFNVQGREFKDFDIWVKAGGPRRAYVESVPIQVTNGEFRIVFRAQVENPTINAIEIVPQPDPATGALPAIEPIRIKAGVSAPFTDYKGQVWQPDTGFEGGMTSQIGGPDGNPSRNWNFLPGQPVQWPEPPPPE
ncbi:MAG: malectin domain-containing carbohydrate-binding protein, partial [Verrucomicrobiae bacterium]|nr:malectin domain-containing carbohydrate-binding protein [Verrucomicrobiae bacterium]